MSVYVHIGPPKTATTYLQDVLSRNPRRLAELGVAFPKRPLDHFHAALDVRGLSFGGYDDPRTSGAWERFVGDVMASGGEKAVVSHEVLASATPEQVETVVRAFAPAQVHVVYGARDLARQIPAVWQESLKNRRTRPYKTFLRAVLEKSPGVRSNAGFWAAQDPLRVLAGWAAHVRPDHIHVVTLPPSGAPAGVLWQRFCAALRIDSTGFDLDVARANTSLTAPEAEVLRRLNGRLSSDLEWPEYERLVKRRFNQLVDRGDVGKRLRVPRRFRDQLLQRTDEVCRGLDVAGYDIVGEVDDLRPVDESFGKVRPPSVNKIANTAVELLATVVQAPTTPVDARRDHVRRWMLRLRRGQR